MNELLSNQCVSTTSPATPGLLITCNYKCVSTRQAKAYVICHGNSSQKQKNSGGSREQEKMLFFPLKIPPDTFMKLNQIKEAHDFKAHSRQERMMILVPLLSGKVFKLNQLKEAYNIKAEGPHDTMMFF